jgi:Protein of unknown function (DUF1501)
MRTRDDFASGLNRRAFLGQSSLGLGAVALDSMFEETPGGVIHPPHVRPRARRVIFLCMAGGPSQFETFDYKPELARLDGRPMPSSYTAGQPIAQLQGKKLNVLGPLTKFRKHGECGRMVSDFLPYTAQIVDDIAVIKSMTTTQINHDPAHTVMNTGTQISGRPSMGSWINYGLGSEAKDLPGFVVLSSIKGRNPQPIAARQWHSGFLPSRFQGVEFHAHGDPVHYLSNPTGITAARQRDVVDTVARLDRIYDRTRDGGVHDPEIEARLSQYEMAFRMQTSVPELMDFGDEPQHILDLYGTKGGDGSYASNCLLARRLAERGVRFIQLYHRGWDHHGDLRRWMDVCCGATDRATAALLLDLKQRGMLDDTLIVWGGEFGRTPMFQGKGSTPGRDHHIRCFSMWLAGGGVKGGISYGESDDLGYGVGADEVGVHDLHATMLHLLGIDHERFTVKFQGLDVKLTGVERSRVVSELLV